MPSERGTARPQPAAAMDLLAQRGDPRRPLVQPRLVRLPAARLRRSRGLHAEGRPRHALPRRRASSGIALIEALVSVLLFALGILGLLGLQASLAQAQGAAKLRADAAYLATGLVGQMWADQPNLAAYGTRRCLEHPRCAEWNRKLVAALPAGAADVMVHASGDVQLTVTWTTPTEGSHQYVLATTIR